MTNYNYIVVKSPLQPRAWAILNTATGEIVEGGFFSQTAAERWLGWYYHTPTT